MTVSQLAVCDVLCDCTLTFKNSGFHVIPLCVFTHFPTPGRLDFHVVKPHAQVNFLGFILHHSQHLDAIFLWGRCVGGFVQVGCLYLSIKHMD